MPDQLGIEVHALRKKSRQRLFEARLRSAGKSRVYEGELQFDLRLELDVGPRLPIQENQVCDEVHEGRTKGQQVARVRIRDKQSQPCHLWFEAYSSCMENSQ